MKKFISALLATVMLLSVMPITGFAEEKTANESVVETAGENNVPENWGTEAYDGKALYYIEDGSLLYSENNGRPQTVSSDVNWVIKRGKAVYYAKIEGNNTDIYKKDLSDGSDFEKLTRLFVPVDCFDADGDRLYYLWNGEITKQNVATGEEKFVQTFDGDRFWISSTGIIDIHGLYNNIADENDDEFDSNVNLSDMPSFTDKSIYLKQQSGDTCTLVSALMMFRRGAIINKNENWK